VKEESVDWITLQSVAHVVGGRRKPTDDYWGGSRSIIRIDNPAFGPDSVKNLQDFSHLEVVFHFHLQDADDVSTGARRPRNNPAWPEVGVFGHRNMRRINRLGVSRCRLIGVDGLDLHVQELDAVDGTPILDIKPWFVQMGPQGPVTQPDWPTEMLKLYYAEQKDAPANESR